MYKPLTEEEKEFFAIQKAKFRIKQIRQVLVNDENSYKMNWRLYRKGFLGFWYWVDDYKWFSSAKEVIRQLILKQIKKNSFKKRIDFYYDNDGYRINKKDVVQK